MILELHEKLKNKEISAVELTNKYLQQAREKNKELNSFINFCETEALAQAREADKMIERGEMTLLTGIPYSLKDNFCTKGITTTAGSKILENYKPPYSATAYEKLQEAGAVLIGKNNMDEFAMGASGEHSAYGPTKNPLDIAKVPGGSSSGAAAAVASEQVVFALGTDTGGSIRQPAAFCEITGLKPTYGRVSRQGVLAMASSLDTIGPLTKTPEDAAIVLNIIAGQDKKDSTTPEIPVDNYLEEINKPLQGLKVGVPQEYFGEGVSEEVKCEVEQAIEKLKSQGAEIKDISLEYSKYAISVYYVICPSEVSSNLARYDGIKHGAIEEAEDLLSFYMKTRGKYLGDEVKRRIMLGTFALSAGYQDAYYKQAQKVRTLIRQDFNQAFDKVDILIGPTTPTPAFGLGEKLNDPLAMYMSDLLTAPANIAGIPGVSVGKGIQVLGPQFSEARVLQVAKNVL